jgi:fused signal recognition particle receptor
MADVGVAAAGRIIAAVKQKTAAGGPARRGEGRIRAIFAAVPPLPGRASNDHLLTLCSSSASTVARQDDDCQKLAQLLKSSGKQPLVVAPDTFRAAAVEQLEIWARRAGVDLIRARDGADPAAVVFDGIAAGKAKGRDPILVDTAGRLHTKVNLMNELDKIRRIAAREVVGAPHEVLLVLDATVGQNGLSQAREFMNVAGVNGVVLTKLDGTAKGGIAIAIACELSLPIRYVGVGESIDDLIPFDVNEYVDALFEQKW